MIKYRCKNCEISCETSECVTCGERTEVRSEIFWCEQCNIPIYEKQCSICEEEGKYISTDIRPVFPEERLLLEILLGEPFKFIQSSVWSGTGSRYIVDGESINVTLQELMKNDCKIVINELARNERQNTYQYFDEYIERFIKANEKRFNFIMTEASDFIINEKQNYYDDETFVSFSGGKDSTVVSDLVIKALGNPSIIHIFGDTTLEFPMTLEYMERLKKQNKKTPILSAQNKEKDFYDMCEVIGPPARVMRWCCIVFKTGPISKKISSIFRGKRKVLTFYGIRRNESNSRNKYDRVADSPKITKQEVVSPIIDWYDFDVWLYILTTGIDFNDAYRLGYARVGCWCCPNNTEWAQYLSSIYMSEQATKWRNQLIEFAKKIGKPDPEVYIDTGNWKMRQGGNGVEYSQNTFVDFKPCVVEEDTFSYELNKEITQELYEYFKPFGWVNYELGNKRLGQVYIVDKNNNPIMRLQGKIGSKEIKVTIIKLPIAGAKNIQAAKLKVDCQLTKYQMCLGCLACESVCKHDAITVYKHAHQNELKLKDNIDYYKINDKKCVRCGECVNHFDGGCYMRKIVITRRGEE